MAAASDEEHQKERGTESMRESEKEERKNKKMRVHGREREINKKLIALCYSAISKMRAHCSSIVNFLAFTIFDGANFWVINAKKKHLLGFAILDKNALSVLTVSGFFFFF